MSPAQFSQHLVSSKSKSFRPVGERFGRRIEAVFGLPEKCMDSEDGVVPHLGTFIDFWRARGMLAVLPAEPAPEGELQKGLTPARLAAPYEAAAVVRHGPRTRARPALHQATLDALDRALSSGKINDQECLRLMAQWIAPQ